MRSHLRSFLSFCQFYYFRPFPVSKTLYLLYLVFSSRSLSSYPSVLLKHLGIIKNINRSLGVSLAFPQDYEVYLAKQAVRRILGDRVTQREPITIEILYSLARFHACFIFSSFLFVPTHFQFSPLQFGWHERSSRLSLNTICHFYTTWGLVTHHAYQDHTISGTGVRNSLATYFWLTSLPRYSAYTVFGQCSATTSITFICLQLAGRLQAYPGSPV